MLAKTNRLTKRGSFAYVYKKGNSVRGQHFTLIFTQGKDYPRIGLSVSNKVGHAVVRNKIKRRMRAALRESIARIKPCQAVIVAKNSATDVTFDAIRQEILTLLTKSKLIVADEKKE